MTIALTAALALPGCTAVPQPPSTPNPAALGEWASRAIAADSAKLLLQSQPPARTTLRLTRSAHPSSDADAAFDIELVRQLRTHGYAVWELPPPDATAPSNRRPAQALTATLRLLPAVGVMYCAVVRVDDNQWARCYHLAAGSVRPAGPWSRMVLPTGSP